ncbi:hypothetical protein Kfla_2575 [Kribbella flavida DSM 17836]|uniref:Lipoprotein n=1 Tax=Kribbella flavida (strain DSM 17836 / JCM 10339 / NBRC 14399) TaxID=479435 RepID=D2PXK1_KRIFD|nr:hypothetical protein [Kribbella flavida]ADB31643.1 hypothetical protein Kfla_2575 [Kribbella flavida DSM 17836]
MVRRAGVMVVLLALGLSGCTGDDPADGSPETGIQIVITNESGNDLSGVVAPSLRGLRRTGGQPDVALIGGDIPGCRENVAAPDDFDHKGATWVVCEFEVSSAARPVRTIAYDEPPYGVEPRLFDDPPPRFNQYYGLGAITWR